MTSSMTFMLSPRARYVKTMLSPQSCAFHVQDHAVPAGLRVSRGWHISSALAQRQKDAPRQRRAQSAAAHASEGAAPPLALPSSPLLQALPTGPVAAATCSSALSCARRFAEAQPANGLRSASGGPHALQQAQRRQDSGPHARILVARSR